MRISVPSLPLRTRSSPSLARGTRPGVCPNAARDIRDVTLARTLTGIVAAILLALARHGRRPCRASEVAWSGHGTSPSGDAEGRNAAQVRPHQIACALSCVGVAHHLCHARLSHAAHALDRHRGAARQGAARSHGTHAFVAWAHPTTGIARKCAPIAAGSLRLTSHRSASTISWRAAVVVAATDYPGLGTDGPDRLSRGARPGLSRRIDSGEAPQSRFPASAAATDYALWGYSQGGHAVLFLRLTLASRLCSRTEAQGCCRRSTPHRPAGPCSAPTVATVSGRILASFTLSSWNLKYGAPLEHSGGYARQRLS